MVLSVSHAEWCPLRQYLQVLQGTWCDTNTRSLDTIQAGLNKYLRHVKSLHYPYDFVYLSATHAPLMYDNVAA